MNCHHLTNVTKSCLHAVTAEQSILSYRHIYYVHFIVYLRWLQIFVPLKWVTIYGRVLDYYSHLLIFIAPVPSNIMFAAFWFSPMAELNANLFMGLYIYRLEFLSIPKFGSRALTYLLYAVSKGIFLLKISITRAENALVISWRDQQSKIFLHIFDFESPWK